MLSATLDKDCFVRASSTSDTPAIFVGNTLVDPTTLDSICCVQRGRVSGTTCNYGCGHSRVATSDYWTSDSPLHSNYCFVQCYWL